MYGLRLNNNELTEKLIYIRIAAKAEHVLPLV